MSWQEDIENKSFAIITGDGREYLPKWKNAVKAVEYNVSVFDFVNVAGSLVDRRKPKANKFDLEFYFDGENAIQDGNNFAISARDNRRWTIKHPFYGEIKCQPLSLSQDNSALNCSKFIVPVLETLIEGWPKSEKLIPEEITRLQAKINLAQATDLKTAGINKTSAKELVKSLDTTYSKAINDDIQLATFKKYVSDAIIAIDSVEFEIVEAARNIQTIINFPATIARTVLDRLNVLLESINNIFDSYTGVFVSKKHVENFAGAVISALNVATISNITTDYKTRSDVDNIQSMLLAAYNRYLAFLDSMQTKRADSGDSYTPNFESVNSLDELIHTTLSSLYSVAFGAKQEHSIILEKDSNPIILTHRFYGLDSDDVKLNNFIEENNLSMSELLNIRKGKKIIYYV